MEGAFRAIECRLAQMNVFSRYCLTFSANDCVFSRNEQQKVYDHTHESIEKPAALSQSYQESREILSPEYRCYHRHES